MISIKRFFAFMALAIMAGSSLVPASMSAQTGDLFFGQEHSYSVIFRGNGEAVVYGKIVFTNTGDRAISDFTLDIPKVDPKELMVLQGVGANVSTECPDYPNMPYGFQCPTNYYYDYYTGNQKYYNPGTDYEKLETQTAGTVTKMKFKQEVQPKQKGTLILAYVASGYVEKSFGVYRFKYETPKVDSRISRVTVSVDVDSDLVLKGKKSEVQYATSGLIDSFASSAPAMDGARYSGQEFSGVVNRIGAGGPVNKSAQNLSPNESFSVNGEYAESLLALNAIKIVLGGLAVVLIIIGMVLMIRRWRKNHQDAPAQQSVAASVSETDTRFRLIHPMYSSVGAAAAVLIYGAIYLAQLYMRTTSYYGYSYGYGTPFMLLAVTVIVGIVVICAIVLPPVIVSSKFGWRAGISVMANTFLSILILLALYILLNLLGVWPNFGPEPVSYPIMY